MNIQRTTTILLLAIIAFATAPAHAASLPVQVGADIDVGIEVPDPLDDWDEYFCSDFYGAKITENGPAYADFELYGGGASATVYVYGFNGMPMGYHSFTYDGDGGC